MYKESFDETWKSKEEEERHSERQPRRIDQQQYRRHGYHPLLLRYQRVVQRTSSLAVPSRSKLVPDTDAPSWCWDADFRIVK
jgi:hypothetical protein